MKSNQDKRRVKALAPIGTDVDVNDSGELPFPPSCPSSQQHIDVFKTGAVITAVCLVIFVLTTLYLVILLARPTSFTRPRFIASQGGILAFFAFWLFAALVPYTQFFRTRSAIITATLDGTPIPQSVVQSLVQSQGAQHGLTPVYKDHEYRKLWT